MCLGYGLAKLEAILTLVLIYQKYTFSIASTTKKTVVDFTVSLVLSPKYPLDLIPRKRAE